MSDRSVGPRLLTILAGVGWVFGMLVLVLPGSAAADNSVLSPLAAQSLLLDCSYVDGLGIAVGERGHILRSEDGGHRWQQIAAPTRATLTGVFFINRQNGWVVGHDQVILRTRDGGVTWTLVFSAPQQESPLLDVWFSDEEHGIAVGAYGRYLETEDGGIHWRARMVSEDDFHFNRVVPTQRHLFLVGEAGSVLRSDDGGGNWEQLESPYEGSFFGGLSLGDDRFLLFGLRGHLFSTPDAGMTWDSVDSWTEAGLTDGASLTDSLVFVVGLGGTVLVSKDGGRTFVLHMQLDRKGFSALARVDAESAIAVGEFGVKLLTEATIHPR